MLSIDYAKSPEHPYPHALNDCWQVYNWLRNESHYHFRLSPNKKIIVAGDSSGGNLSLALTNLCIANDVRSPDAIATFYPGTTSPIKLPI